MAHQRVAADRGCGSSHFVLGRSPGSKCARAGREGHAHPSLYVRNCRPDRRRRRRARPMLRRLQRRRHGRDQRADYGREQRLGRVWTTGGCGLPVTGQLTSYGPGSDGDVRAGAAPLLTENGDGTITDNVTKLMWEKKDDAGGIHDQDNTYTWGEAAAPFTMNGTMVMEFLSALNTPPCFAGHCDWRIPNVRELQSLVDYEATEPAVFSGFNRSCAPGCTIDGIGGTMCSCTSRTSTGLPLPSKSLRSSLLSCASTLASWTGGTASRIAFTCEQSATSRDRSVAVTI